MKRAYVKPMMVGEEFVANEYFASTCGKAPNGDYIFKCDAPGGHLYYYPNGKDKGATLLGKSYHDCGETHRSDGPDYYYDGFVDYNKNGVEDTGEGKLVWVEFYRYGGVKNAHASASLSREMIDVVRS